MRREECEEWQRGAHPVSGEVAELIVELIEGVAEIGCVYGGDLKAPEITGREEVVEGLERLRAHVERLAREVEELKRDNRERRDEYNEVNERANQCSRQRCELLNEAATLRARVAELEASRRAYASEFPLGADGEPDTGSIHENIRRLKAERATLDVRLLDAVQSVPASGKE